jgi:hypothetical protein
LTRLQEFRGDRIAPHVADGAADCGPSKAEQHARPHGHLQALVYHAPAPDRKQ